MSESFETLRGRLKQMGDQFVSTRAALQTRFEELRSREEAIGRREKLLEEKESGFRSKEAELEAIEEAITEKLLDFEEGKTRLESLGILIREKEMECDLMRNRVEKGARDLARVEEMVRKCMEDWRCMVELKERELEEGLFEKLRLKEELLEPNMEELRVIANDVQECINEAQRKERELESKAKELELAEVRVNECRNEVQWKERRVESAERRVEERRNQVELKEKHLCSMEKLIEDNKKGLDLLMKTAEKRQKDLESLQKSVEVRERNLDLVSDELKRKERELQQQAEALKLKRAQFDSQVTIQQLEYMPGDNNAIIPSPVTNIISSLVKAEEPDSSLPKNSASLVFSNLQPIATSDEGYVPGFLNKNSSGNNFIQNALANSLRLVPDPAKLVLNNMQKSLVQYLTNGYFEESLMSGNISILMELMSMSPNIGSHLKVDATYLALKWKIKMTGNSENSVESLAFLLFLATYGILYMLNEDEIVKLLGLISQNKRAGELCQTPAFAVMIADLIRNLIEKKRLLEAVKCICMFKLSDKLPLVPLLEEYVRETMKCSEAICGLRNTPDEKVKFLINQIADARVLVQCLKDYNLGYLSNVIQILIVQLETLEESWRLFLPHLCPSIVGQQEHRKRKKHNNSTYDPESHSQQPREVKFVIRDPRT
ncbi:hypothetical protein ACLB2K_057365 [Fragaria x ananassa]